MSTLAERHRLSRMLRRLNPSRPDGRKTEVKRVNRRRPHELPDWRLSFMLPDGHSVRPGQTFGVAGIVFERVGKECRATITGKNRDYVEGKAELFLSRAGIARVRAVLARENEPKGYRRAIEIHAKAPGVRAHVVETRAGMTAMRMLPLFMGA